MCQPLSLSPLSLFLFNCAIFYSYYLPITTLLPLYYHQQLAQVIKKKSYSIQLPKHTSRLFSFSFFLCQNVFKLAKCAQQLTSLAYKQADAYLMRSGRHKKSLNRKVFTHFKWASLKGRERNCCWHSQTEWQTDTNDTSLQSIHIHSHRLFQSFQSGIWEEKKQF